MYDSLLTQRPFRLSLFVFATFFASLFFSRPASAQLGSENVRGDFGLKSGSQAPPGFYVGDLFYFYRPDELRGVNGNRLPGSLSLNLFADYLSVGYISGKKILGANYGFSVAAGVLNNKLELPELNIGSSSGGFGDMYFQPLNLGWHFKHADAFIGYGFFAPTGRYTAGALDNSGLGMWSNEFSAGTTVYLDPAKKWNAAAAGFYEIHTSKKGLDEQVGDVFTLEGGVGRSFLKGYANTGLAYYGQWKVTPDGGLDVPLLIAGQKGSMLGLGPELNMPLGKHPIFLTVRYLFDTRSRLSTQGNSLVISIAFTKPAAAQPPPPPSQ